MTKVIIFLMMAVVWMSSFADEPARISANVGVLAPYTLDATIGYERPVGYGHSLCLFGEAGNRWQTPACHMFWKKYYWDGGVEYKHRLVRYKNGSFRIFGGAYCGAYVREFFFGCQAGFEYNYTFANNWQLSVTQKNNFNFLHGDTFRNGLMIGLKIPI